ncbi:hypothetical protein CEN45_13255 [Fischerella thermalis CCMEE 5198]|jgi:hypothetical protein|nr:hypothetical protein CI594_14570 [Fischerella thermalis CCMEE 5196]PMB21981.1 hypothetical protein CEN45_13255 [Fischerella thermalis CCMEE 5198]
MMGLSILDLGLKTIYNYKSKTQNMLTASLDIAFVKHLSQSFCKFLLFIKFKFLFHETPSLTDIREQVS